MNEALWRSVVSDDRVWLGRHIKSDFLRDFIETTVPSVLKIHWDKIVTIESLMEAQYIIAEAMAKMVKTEKFVNIAAGLAQHEHATFFLETLGYSTEAYCLQPLGMTSEEFEAMGQGDITIGQLLEENPIVFLAPILPRNEYRVN